MLEFVDIKECVVRDGKVVKLLERVRQRWVEEIPPPLPPSSTTKKVVTLIAQDEAKPLDATPSQPAEESKPDEDASVSSSGRSPALNLHMTDEHPTIALDRPWTSTRARLDFLPRICRCQSRRRFKGHH